MKSIEFMLPAREGRLVKVVSDYSRIPFEEVLTHTQCILGLPPKTASRNRYASKLNNDGSPLQACLSFSPTGITFRIIGEPGSDLRDSAVRHEHALFTLNAMLFTLNLTELIPLVKTTLHMNLPLNLAASSEFDSGAMWLALSLQHSGAALYLKANWGNIETQWERAYRWLDEMVPLSPRLVRVLKCLSSCAEVSSLGLEGSNDRTVQYKIYFRLKDRVRLDKLGIDLFTDHRLSSFLNCALGDYGISSSGLVFSLGFSPFHDHVENLKIDICGHCLSQSGVDGESLLNECLLSTGLPHIDSVGLKINTLTQLAFIGFGLNHARSPRLNLYLKGHG